MTGAGSVAAAIIGGGKAARLGGRPKHLLMVDGRRIVDRQLEALRACFAHVLIAANDAAAWAGLGLMVIDDRVTGGVGPLAGIDATLGALPPGIDAVVCVACDMPYLDPRALVLVRDHAPDADVAIPIVGGLPEPLFARYGRGCAAAIRAQLASGDYKVTHFLDRVRVAWIDEPTLRVVDPALRSLTNVNTLGDLRLNGK